MVAWIRANRISINVNKTKIVLFRPHKKTFSKKLNFRISGQKIIPSDQVYYLGITLDKNLSFTTHTHNVRNKLSRANGLLAKIRHHINKDALKTIYHAIFCSYMNYAAQIWGLSSKNISNSIQKLQNKALRIINFKKYYDECEILFRQCKILKFEDTIFYNNCLFVSNCLAKTIPEAFNNTYKLTQDNHTYSTRGSRNKLIDVPKVNTHYYGTNSFKLTSLRQWNSLQNTLNFDLTEHHRKKTQFKKIHTHFFNLLNYILSSIICKLSTPVLLTYIIHDSLA